MSEEKVENKLSDAKAFQSALSTSRPLPSQSRATCTSYIHSRFIAEHNIMWYAIPFWPVEVNSSGCIPFLCTPHLLTGRAVQEAEKFLA